MPIPCVPVELISDVFPERVGGEAKLPIWIPGYPAPYDPLIREKTPENEEREEQIRRRPSHESVELWRSRPVFLRPRREFGQRRGWRGRFLHYPRLSQSEREYGCREREREREEGAARSAPLVCRDYEIPKLINSPTSGPRETTFLPFSIRPNRPPPSHGYGLHPESETSPTENRFRQLEIPLPIPNPTPVCANLRNAKIRERTAEIDSFRFGQRELSRTWSLIRECSRRVNTSAAT